MTEAVATQMIEENQPAGVDTTVKKQAYKDLQKTRLCVYNIEGKCGFGAECKFAHSATEVRGVPDLKKTQICSKFMEGKCSNENCSFAHGEEELRDAPNFKMKLCKWNVKGNCRNGAKCGFAHSSRELKGVVEPPPGFEPIPGSVPPWRTGKVAPPPGLEKMPHCLKARLEKMGLDDGDASTIAPSSQVSKAESNSSVAVTEAPLFRLAAARGAAPIQQQVALMTSAISGLQAKLEQLEGMVMQTQVDQMQQSIQQLNEQCWALQNGLVAQPPPETEKSRLNAKAQPFVPSAPANVSEDSTSIGSSD